MKIRIVIVVVSLVVIAGAIAYFGMPNGEVVEDEASMPTEEVTQIPEGINQLEQTKITIKRKEGAKLVPVEITVPKSSKPGYHIYRNEEWNFQFEFPDNWELWENSFSAGSSQFNMVLLPLYEPRFPRAILLNVTHDSWANNLITKVRSQGREIKESTIDGHQSFTFNSTDMGQPTEEHFIYIDNERWISIGVTNGFGYEEVFEEFKNSLQFFPEKNVELRE